jgi:hypothetical protein
MKLKDGFILRKVGRQYVVAATGEASKNFNGMIRMDESGAYAFELLREEVTEQDFLNALAEKYAMPEAQLQPDVIHFLEKLKEADALV